MPRRHSVLVGVTSSCDLQLVSVYNDVSSVSVYVGY